MSDIDFSEACGQLILIFQEESLHLEEYQVMMMSFIQAIEDGDTMRMAVTLAKQSILDNSLT